MRALPGKLLASAMFGLSRGVLCGTHRSGRSPAPQGTNSSAPVA